MTTYKQMCETIAEAGFLENGDGKLMTAEEIFNYSPSGELMRIHEWYLYTMHIRGRLREVIKKTARWDDNKTCFIADQDVDAGDFVYLSEDNKLMIAAQKSRCGEVLIATE